MFAHLAIKVRQIASSFLAKENAKWLLQFVMSVLPNKLFKKRIFCLCFITYMGHLNLRNILFMFHHIHVTFKFRDFGAAASNSWVWKSLEDSLPKLYCVTWRGLCDARKLSLRIFVSKKGMIRACPLDSHTRNLRQKAERGKITGSESSTRFPWASCFEKLTRSVPETWRRTYDVLPRSTKGMRKWDEKSDSHAAKNGTKKLVSSNFAKNTKIRK